MKRYHLHIFDGRTFQWDGAGIELPDLATVVEQAEAKARATIQSHPDIRDWTRWKIDVRGHDDITLFHYPFSEARNLRELN